MSGARLFRKLALLVPVLLVLTVPAGAQAKAPHVGAAARHVQAIADHTEAAQKLRTEHPGLRARTPYWGGEHWFVDYPLNGRTQLEVEIDHGYHVVHIWSGLKARASFTRGGFGDGFNSPWVWLTFSLLFVAPFIDPRRPFRLLHLDLLVLLSFIGSYLLLIHGGVEESILLFYPPLIYLLGRMLWTGLRPRRPRGRLVPHAPMRLLVVGLVLLAGARVALNVTTPRTFDISYSSVVGADRVEHKEQLYVDDSGHLDTYGPLMYIAYVPFELVFPWHGNWDGLPAAHAAAIVFDVLTLIGLVLLGRRLRAGPEGRRLGVALAWAWAAFPFTLFGLMESTNDGFVAMLLVYLLVVFFSPAGRGALLGAAAAAKFFPGALITVVAAGAGKLDRRRFAISAAVCAAVFGFAIRAYLPDGGLREVWNCTLGYQLSREPDFSLWAVYTGIGWTKTVAEVLGVGLALLLAVYPRRRSLVQAGALAAAVTIAFQLPTGHWWFFYIVWFAPLVLVALFGGYLGEEPSLDAGRLDEEIHLLRVARARKEDELVSA
ncbi:MAG TPA: hypothetical protein VH817_17075 [Thermoleophilaceae bacterium]